MSPIVHARCWAVAIALVSAPPLAHGQSVRSERAAAPTQQELARAPARASRWLPWTLFGLGAAATATTLVAFAQRERHATRWNGAACVQPGVTRGSVCAGELDAIHDWDRVLLVSGLSAGVFIGAAVLLRGLEPSPEARRTGLHACALSVGAVTCQGHF